MNSLNTKILKQMFINGSELIEKNYEYIDELNVFPVPDGDTGTNIKITVHGACDSIASLETDDVFLFTKTFARGLLMNARGNSGVILSQIFKGFSLAFTEGQQEVTISDIVSAFVKAKEIAYKSVATAVEGTILTVIRVVSEKLIENASKHKDMESLFAYICQEAETILAKTPDFLIQLKEVGVVDSGGYGLCRFFEGMNNFFAQKAPKKETNKAVKPDTSLAATKSIVATADDNHGFGYCCEFIMKIGSKVVVEQDNKEDFDERYFKKNIEKMGDSFVYVKDEDIIKVHVHVTSPARLLAFAARYGEFNKVKIENMTLQFLQRNPGTTLEQGSKEFNKQSQIEDTIKVVATVPSENIQKIYKDQFKITNTINCDSLGNPSIQQFLDLIKSTKANKVILVTDNGNVLMAANEAIRLIPKEEIMVYIIPTKDIGASYLACLGFNPQQSIDTNIKRMRKIIKSAIVGKVSRSIKSVRYSKTDVHVDDYIGIIDKEILFSSKDMDLVVNKLIRKLFSEKRRAKTVVVITGKDTTIRNARDIEKFINETYGIKPIFVSGDQSVYHFYIAICD